MTDIDLIPQAYRTRRWQMRLLKQFGWILGSLTGLLAVSAGAIDIATARTTARLETLQQRQAYTAQQRADIDRLNEQKAELERQLRMLSGLRSGAAAGDMFLTVDRALTSDDVWFLDWEFSRAGIVVGDEIHTVNTGYFIVVPEGAPQPPAEGLRVRTHMTIRGQARDHSALSGFVRRLFVQPEIDDVRIRRTSLVQNDSRHIVAFELAIVLNTQVRSNP